MNVYECAYFNLYNHLQGRILVLVEFNKKVSTKKKERKKRKITHCIWPFINCINCFILKAAWCVEHYVQLLSDAE